MFFFFFLASFSDKKYKRKLVVLCWVWIKNVTIIHNLSLIYISNIPQYCVSSLRLLTPCAWCSSILKKYGFNNYTDVHVWFVTNENVDSHPIKKSCPFQILVCLWNQNGNVTAVYTMTSAVTSSFPFLMQSRVEYIFFFWEAVQAPVNIVKTKHLNYTSWKYRYSFWTTLYKLNSVTSQSTNIVSIYHCLIKIRKALGINHVP